MGLLSATNFFSEVFTWFANLSAKLPQIDYKTYFIVVVALLIGVGVIVGFTFFGTYRFKLMHACKKIIRYLDGVESIVDDNFGDFTSQCFSQKAPASLRDCWVQYLGVRFGYPSDIVSEENVYDKPVKRVREIRANVYIAIALIMLAIFAFWGYGTLDGKDMGVIFLAGLLLSGVIYLVLVILNRMMSKRCLDVFDRMQEDLDAKVNLQVEKRFSTDSSPLFDLSAIIDEIVARNTAKELGFEFSEDVTPIEQLIAEAEQTSELQAVEDEIDYINSPSSDDNEDSDEEDIEQTEQAEEAEVVQAEENITEEVAEVTEDEIAELSETEDIAEETNETEISEIEDVTEVTNEDELSEIEEITEETAESEINEEAALEDEKQSEDISEAVEDDVAEEAPVEEAIEDESDPVNEQAEEEIPQDEEAAEEALRKQDGDSVEQPNDSVEEISDQDGVEEESAEPDGETETETEQSEEIADVEENRPDANEAEENEDGDGVQEDEVQSASDGLEDAASEQEPEVRYIVDGPSDEDELVKPAKLVKLPNLVDYMLAQKLSRKVKINMAMLLLSSYKKFENSAEDKAIILGCMKKLLFDLQSNK